LNAELIEKQKSEIEHSMFKTALFLNAYQMLDSCEYTSDTANIEFTNDYVIIHADGLCSYKISLDADYQIKDITKTDE